MRNVVRAGLAFAMIATASSSVRADDDPDRRAFSAGLACFDDARYPCAIEAWEGLVERVGTSRAWKVLYNLGIAHDEMGDATRALDRWEAFLDAAPASEAGEQRADAQRRIAGLRARFGEIIVPAREGAAATARVGVGRERAAGFRVLVAPGRHTITLLEPGRPSANVVVDVAAGAREEVKWPASPAPEPPAPKPPPPGPPATESADPSAVPTALAIAFGAATAVSFALPIGLGLSASSTRDEAAAAITREDYERAAGDFEDQKTLYGASYVVPAILGVATIGFVVWAVSAGSSGSSGAAHSRFQLQSGLRPFLGPAPAPPSPELGPRSGAWHGRLIVSPRSAGMRF